MLKSPRNFKEKLILLPTFEEIQNPVCSEFSHGLDDALCGATLVLKLIMTDGIIAFAIWGLGPLMRLGRTLLFLSKYFKQLPDHVSTGFSYLSSGTSDTTMPTNHSMNLVAYSQEGILYATPITRI
ncbi:hypothetical protein D5086_027816 [Populus alba]|uniref:Uncharacterized protein n=1 Tax=Populus alba TaxID=43335 RepID=A0ACC4AWF8_POPAL